MTQWIHFKELVKCNKENDQSNFINQILKGVLPLCLIALALLNCYSFINIRQIRQENRNNGSKCVCSLFYSTFIQFRNYRFSSIRVKVMLQCRSRIHGPLYLHIYHNFLYSLEIESQWKERLGIPSKLVV